jgi:hypothetical protein
MEDLAFRSPKDPNVLYDPWMVCSKFHELDMLEKDAFGNNLGIILEKNYNSIYQLLNT